jgi:hypothetical protein
LTAGKRQKDQGCANDPFSFVLAEHGRTYIFDSLYPDELNGLEARLLSLIHFAHEKTFERSNDYGITFL